MGIGRWPNLEKNLGKIECSWCNEECFWWRLKVRHGKLLKADSLTSATETKYCGSNHNVVRMEPFTRSAPPKPVRLEKLLKPHILEESRRVCFEFIWLNIHPLPPPVFRLSCNAIRLRSDAYPRTLCSHLVCGLDKYNENVLSNSSSELEDGWNGTFFLLLGKQFNRD